MKKDHKIGEGRPDGLARFMWFCGSFVARKLYNKTLNIQLKNFELFDRIEPPFLILGNHVTNYDPVIISSNQKHMIHWVAGDAVFRHPVLRWGFNRIQTIPKTKGTSDLDTVRLMHHKVREGGVVGLFPEGHTCWDGKTHDVMPATAKLIKMLKVPVISVVNRGGYMTQPRWVWPRNKRRSRILLEANLTIGEDEIKRLSVDDIDRKITKALSNDDFLFQKENPVLLESEKRAEHLELFAYICPTCGSLGALRSKGNDVKCLDCGWAFSMDPYGQFPGGEDFPFADLTEWDAWQQADTRKKTEVYLADDTPSAFLLEDRNITLLTGAGLVPLNPLCKGDARLLKDRILFTPEKGAPLSFLLKEVEAVSIFKQQKLEFYYNKVLYRFHFDKPWDSAYKWLSFIETLLKA